MLEEPFQVRSVKDGDLDQVMRINLTCLPENYSQFFYRQLVRRFPKTFIVALINDEVVGYIMCRIEMGFSEMKRLGLAKKGHVVSIAVLPRRRRQGIGHAIVSKALRGMKEEYGASESFLEVRVSNMSAINLYKKLGFKIIRRISRYYKDGEDAYLMGKEI